MSLTIKHYATKTCRGVMVYFHSFLVLALDRGEWSGSIASHLIPVKEPPVTDRQENSWATKSVWSGDREKSACSSQESKSSRLVTIQNKPFQCLTYHCYVRAPLSLLQSTHKYLPWKATIPTGHAPVSGHLRTVGVTESHPADSVDCRPKQCSTLFVAARLCLVSAIMFWGN